MALEQLTPSAVAQLRGEPRGVDYVGEQDGGEDAVVLARLDGSGNETLYLVEDCLADLSVPYVESVIATGKAEEAGIRDPGREQFAGLDGDHPIFLDVQDQRGQMHR